MQAVSFNATAKLSHYGVDGTGRDTYINFDNGGNYKGFNQTGKGKFERGTFQNYKYFKKPNPKIEGNPLHYPSDGTGRDTYIIVDQGGLGMVLTNKRANYLNSLRKYQPEKNISKQDIYMNSQHSHTPFLKSKMSGLAKTQSDISNRLSMPKIKEDPYKQMRDTFHKSIKGSYGQWTTRN